MTSAIKNKPLAIFAVATAVMGLGAVAGHALAQSAATAQAPAAAPQTSPAPTSSVKSSSGGTISTHNKKDPIAYSADTATADQTERVEVLTGKVEAIQGDKRLRAKQVFIYHAPKANAQPGDRSMGEVERIEAIGEVYLVSPTQVAKGDKAVYTAADDIMILTGDVVVREGESVMTGNRLVVNNKEGKSQMTAQQDGRVRGVLYPKDETQPGAKSAKPAPAKPAPAPKTN